MFDQVLIHPAKAEQSRPSQVELDIVGRVLAQVEPTSTPVPAQACVHINDEKLQAVQNERDVHHLYAERCRP